MWPPVKVVWQPLDGLRWRRWVFVIGVVGRWTFLLDSVKTPSRLLGTTWTLPPWMPLQPNSHSTRAHQSNINSVNILYSTQLWWRWRWRLVNVQNKTRQDTLSASQSTATQRKMCSYNYCYYYLSLLLFLWCETTRAFETHTHTHTHRGELCECCTLSHWSLWWLWPLGVCWVVSTNRGYHRL